MKRPRKVARILGSALVAAALASAPMILPSPAAGTAHATVCASAGTTSKCEGVPSSAWYGYGYYPPGAYWGAPGYPPLAGAGIPIRPIP
ncbi:hypothetical protein [Mycobacteroides saopaulense]|uniref:hypothetical protein n=1 Tax=Mycobacteroides saopaulense TaxID=1578165 RepID=UPI0012FF69EA|nr:hypothetical protein [Mycobacteroides saopaulense]